MKILGRKLSLGALKNKNSNTKLQQTETQTCYEQERSLAETESTYPIDETRDPVEEQGPTLKEDHSLASSWKVPSKTSRARNLFFPARKIDRSRLPAAGDHDQISTDFSQKSGQSNPIITVEERDEYDQHGQEKFYLTEEDIAELNRRLLKGEQTDDDSLLLQPKYRYDMETNVGFKDSVRSKSKKVRRSRQIQAAGTMETTYTLEEPDMDGCVAGYDDLFNTFFHLTSLIGLDTPAKPSTDPKKDARRPGGCHVFDILSDSDSEEEDDATTDEKREARALRSRHSRKTARRRQRYKEAQWATGKDKDFDWDEFFAAF